MGKCRFGEKCRNIHEDNHETEQISPKTRKNKKNMKNKEGMN